MTADTFPGQIELVVDMAVHTAQSRVNPHQLKIAGLHVIELRAGPGRLVMTGLAFGGKSQRGMGRLLHAGIIVLVAAVADLRGPREGFRMAARAIHARMRSPNGERARMLKDRLGPTRRYRGMALLTIPAEIGQRMIGVGGPVEIIYMASLAFHRGLRKLLPALGDMTGVAIGDNVDTDQRKTALGMGIQDILSILPVIWGMAIPAIDAELRPMDIRVTVDAFNPDIDEFDIDVALPAIGILMCPGQRKAGFGMREARCLFQNPPPLRRMAGVTIPFDIAMRVDIGGEIG
jgi:hypothetical protein